MSTLDILLLALTGLGVGVSALALRASNRKDDRENEIAARDAIRQAVADATAPLIADRDYHRARADQCEARERSRRRD